MVMTLWTGVEEVASLRVVDGAAEVHRLAVPHDLVITWCYRCHGYSTQDKLTVIASA